LPWPDPNRPASLAAATAERPGAAAMPEFWHAWGERCLRLSLTQKTNAQVKINPGGREQGESQRRWGGDSTPAT